MCSAVMTWHNQVPVKKHNWKRLLGAIDIVALHASFMENTAQERGCFLTARLEGGISECACTMIIVMYSSAYDVVTLICA